MSSNKLILIFLGFIFLIIITLSSNRIASSLRTRFGKYFPGIKPETVTISPTPISEEKKIAPTASAGETKGGFTTVSTSSPVSTTEIPATGPTEMVYLILGGSLTAGLTLKRLIHTLPRK